MIRVTVIQAVKQNKHIDSREFQEVRYRLNNPVLIALALREDHFTSL